MNQLLVTYLNTTTWKQWTETQKTSIEDLVFHDGDTQIISVVHDGEIPAANAKSLLHIKDTLHTLGVGFVARGDEGRRVCGGPLVAGPWAYAYGLCSSITNAPMDQKRQEARDKALRTIVVETGSKVNIDGVIYEIEVYRREYIRLTAI